MAYPQTAFEDSVSAYLDEEDRTTEIMDLLDEAREHWDRRDGFRRGRARSRDYRRGRQWEESIEDPDDPGRHITERALITRQKRIPWVMNHISAVVRNLKGQLRQNRSARAVFATKRGSAEAVEALNMALKTVRRISASKVIEPDMFEEHMMSGATAARVSIAYHEELNRNEVQIDPLDQTRLFYNLDLSSRRLDGLRMIGYLHDMTGDEIVASFAIDDDGTYLEEEAERLREVYKVSQQRQSQMTLDFGFERADSLDFYSTYDGGLYRVIEIWCKKHQVVTYAHDPISGTFERSELADEEVDEENTVRAEIGLEPIMLQRRYEGVWHCYFLSPFGDVLFESESPYWHESHPFVVGLATLSDGETWGLVEEIIDPQRWLNRLTSMLDFSLSSSAKGVLAIHEESIPKGMSVEEFAEEWSIANGIVVFKGKPGVPIPQQIATNAIPMGAFEMLQNLKTWIQEVSGVTGPMQGFDPKAGTPAALYQQQVIQAATTNLDFFESFFEFLRALDLKTIKCIMQAWSEPRSLSDGAQSQEVVYEPTHVREMDADVAMGDVADTATYRQLWETDLQQFLGSGYIDFATYLEFSSHPKAEMLLKHLSMNPLFAELGMTPAAALGAAMSNGSAAPSGGPQLARPGGGFSNG